MPLFLFLLFLSVPLVEIAVFIEVGGLLGLWPTIGIVVLTAMLGAMLFRIQGLATLRQAQASLATNVFPAREVFNGLCLLIAGTLLITPGFVTDSLGFLLFFPPFRHFLHHIAERHLMHPPWPNTPDGPETGPRPSDAMGGKTMGGKTIEGVYWEIGSETTRETPAPSKDAPKERKREE